MKGEMEVEVLSEDSLLRDDLAKASRRMSRIVMSEDEQKLYCENPLAARGNKNPGYPVGEDSGYGDTQ